jgi:hypothetical protein
MAKTMSRSTRDECLEKMRCRYRRYTGKPAKGRLLDEFCELTGHERKYASKLLAGRRGPPGGSGGAEGSPSRGGRPPTYDAEVAGVLHEIWKHSEQPCGKRLKPMLVTWLPFYERRYGTLPAELRDGVLSISAAQIDRVLAPRKIGAGAVNRRTPKTNAAIKALVPVRAECWDAREPGWTEADTVASGASRSPTSSAVGRRCARPGTEASTGFAPPSPGSRRSFPSTFSGLIPTTGASF